GMLGMLSFSLDCYKTTFYLCILRYRKCVQNFNVIGVRLDHFFPFIQQRYNIAAHGTHDYRSSAVYSAVVNWVTFITLADY
ncbi:hypothetical protein ACJX0J_036490, partial [Zea mays]